MAWSDNMRCLYCDGKLPLYRKITSGQFCSAVHRKAYWQDQERLAVERLHQTHDSLRAYRPPGALEAILGQPAASEPVSSGHYYLADQVPEIELTPEVEQMARSAANTGNVAFGGFLTEDKPALRAWEALQAAWDTEFAQWPMSASLPESVNERPEYTLAAAHAVAMPRFQANGLAAQIRAEGEKSAPVGFTTKGITHVPLAIEPETEELVPQVEEAPFPRAERMAALPKIGVQATSASKANEPVPLEAVWRAQGTRSDATFAIPAVAPITRMQPLALTNAPQALAARAGAAGDVQVTDLQGYSQPIELKASTGAPWMNLPMAPAEPALEFAPGRRYAIFGSAGAVAGKAIVDSLQSAQALDLRNDTAVPLKQLTTQSLELSLNTAPGARYGIQSQPGTIQPVSDGKRSGELTSILAPQKQLPTQSLELSPNVASPCQYEAVKSQPGIIESTGDVQPVSSRSELRMAPLPDGLGRGERNPAMAKALPLAFAPAARVPAAAQPAATGVALIYPSDAPMNPVAKWEPIEGSAMPPSRLGFLEGWTQTLTNADERKHVWAHAADFWQQAPRDLKLLAIAIPILLGLALRPSLPKVRVTAPASTEGISKNIGNGFREQFINVRNSVAQRAAVSLNEDFRSGLEDWQTRGDLATGWSFDGNGFVRPETLALYRPSLGLTDYDMEFLGLIDKKALSWVVRAKDFDNYYVVKLVVMKAGPLPTIGVTRYAVIDGKAQARVDTVAAIDARPDMLYRVSMNVHDDTFLLSVQGSVVDNWTDSQLKRGGIGFFASKGEESRLRWVQVTHQYDMLGRLCAYLAPYNIPTTNGSW